MRSRGQIERDDAGRMIRRTSATYGAVAISPHRAELCKRRLEWPWHLVFQVEHRKLAEPACEIGTDDPVGSCTRISRCTEAPQRHAEFGLHWGKWFRCPRFKVEAVEIPPVAAIGHEKDCPAVGRPFRLEYRFRHAAGDRQGFTCVPSLIYSREIECRAIPRHIGMIPRQ